MATVRLTGSVPAGERRRVWRALAAAFEDLAEREAIRSVVLLGADSDSFGGGTGGRCREPGEEEARAEAFRAVQRCEAPTVAIVEGLCVGDALELVACCDVRVCGESSRFGEPPEGSTAPTSGDSMAPLERLLGAGPALRRLLDGELMGAVRARSVGLVNRVHPDGSVVERGYGLAARIAAGAPLVNRWHKRMLRRILDPTPVTKKERDEAYAGLAVAGDAGRSARPGREDPPLRIH